MGGSHHQGQEKGHLERRLSTLTAPWNHPGSFKTWRLPGSPLRRFDFGDLACHLGTELFQSVPGDFNVQPGTGPTASRGTSRTALVHDMTRVGQQARLQFVAIGSEEKVKLGKPKGGIGVRKARCPRGGRSPVAAPSASRAGSLCP